MNQSEIMKEQRKFFASVIDARNDAFSVNAYLNQKDLWENAETAFKEAVDDLEENNIKEAGEEGRKAERLFRKAEKEAIETFYLGEARKNLERANDLNADEYAPVTYKLASKFIKNTEKELSKKYYDFDEVRMMAKESEHEARHAIYLNETIKNLKEKNVSYERYMRIMEQHIVNIANALNMSVQFDEGIDVPVDGIIEYINKTVDSEDDLKAEVFNLTVYTNSLKNLLDYKNEQIILLNKQLAAKNENELSMIVAKIKATNETQKKLEAHIARHEAIDSKYRRLREIFSENQARVFKDGDNVIIRLSDFKFNVGEAKILNSNKPVLENIKKALTVFDNEMIVIQGHTDSQGTDDFNIKLSKERAMNVEKYIINNTNVEQIKIKSVGFGESQPLANNEHVEGRAKNRRIDIVIKPMFN